MVDPSYLSLVITLSELDTYQSELKQSVEDKPLAPLNTLSEEKKTTLIREEMNSLKDSVSQTIELLTDPRQAQLLAQLLDDLLIPLSKPTKYEDDLLDFCLAFHALLDCISPDKPFFTEQDITRLIETRDRLIRGTLSDYFHQTAPGNALCLMLQGYYTEANPLAFILKKVLLNKTGKWYDIIENVDELPIDITPYFRTTNNSIHRYDTLVEGAIAAYRRDPYDKQLWQGSDKRQDEGRLSEETLTTLGEKSPTLHAFITLINKQTKQTAVYKALSKLRHGLLLGDVNHEGDEKVAAPVANVAISQFSEWWGTQTKTEKKRIRRINVKGQYLGPIIDILLDPANAYKRDATRYCIETLGENLAQILASDEIKTTMLKGVYQPPDDLAIRIIDELSHPPLDENRRSLKPTSLFNSKHGFEFFLFCRKHKQTFSLGYFIDAERTLSLLIQALYTNSTAFFETYAATQNDLIRRYVLETLLAKPILPKPSIELLKLEEGRLSATFDNAYLKRDKTVSKDCLLLTVFQTAHSPLIERLLSTIEDIGTPYHLSNLPQTMSLFNGLTLMEVAFQLKSNSLINHLTKYQIYIDEALINSNHIECLSYLLKGALQNQTIIESAFLNTLCDFSLTGKSGVILSIISEPYFHSLLEIENKKKIVTYALKNNDSHILSKWKKAFPIPYSELPTYIGFLSWETVKTLCDNPDLPSFVLEKFIERAIRLENADALVMLASFSEPKTLLLFHTDTVCEIAFKKNAPSLIHLTQSRNQTFLTKYYQQDDACLAFLNKYGAEGVSDGCLSQMLFQAIRKDNIALIQAIINDSPKHLELIQHLHVPFQVGDEFHYKHLGKDHWLHIDKTEGGTFIAHDVINGRSFHGDKTIFSNHCITVLGSESHTPVFSKEQPTISPLYYAMKQQKSASVHALLTLGAHYQSPLFINEPFPIQKAYLQFLIQKTNLNAEDEKIIHSLFISAISSDHVDLLRFLFAHFESGANRHVLCQLAFLTKKMATLKFLLEGNSLQDSVFLLRPPYDWTCLTLLFEAYIEQSYIVTPDLLAPILKKAFLSGKTDILSQLTKLGANREHILNQETKANQLFLLNSIIIRPLERAIFLETFYRLYLLEDQGAPKLVFFKRHEWDAEPDSLAALLNYIQTHPKSTSQKILLKLMHHYTDNYFRYSKMKTQINHLALPPEDVIDNEDKMAYIEIQKQNGTPLPLNYVKKWIIDVFISQHPYTIPPYIPEKVLSVQELAPYVNEYNYTFIPRFLFKEAYDSLLKQLATVFKEDAQKPDSPFFKKRLPSSYNGIIQAIHADATQRLKTLLFNVIEHNVPSPTLAKNIN